MKINSSSQGLNSVHRFHLTIRPLASPNILQYFCWSKKQLKKKNENSVWQAMCKLQKLFDAVYSIFDFLKELWIFADKKLQYVTHNNKEA